MSGEWWMLSENEQLVDQGSGLCPGILIPAPVGAALPLPVLNIMVLSSTS